MAQQARAEFLAKRLWHSFVGADSGLRVAQTGATLRSHSLRRSLSWVEKLDNKFVTFRVAKRAVIILERKYHLAFPVIPGVSVEEWRVQQARRISKLCYRAKKNSKARDQPPTPKPAMDQDTLAYDAEARSGACPSSRSDSNRELRVFGSFWYACGRRLLKLSVTATGMTTVLTC